MRLTGTVEERARAAIEFLRAHRSFAYDREKKEALYRKAGVPFTDAADRFFREWDGLFEGDVYWKESKDNPFYRDGERYQADFYFDFFHRAERMKRFYASEPIDEDTDIESLAPDFPAIIRKLYGPETIPLGEGGYYYQGYIYLTPEGKILIHHPDYDDGDVFWDYDDFFDLFCGEMRSPCPDFVEKILAKEEFFGDFESRFLSVVRFARAHGGFERCRLFRINGARLDLRGMKDDPALSEEALAKRLMKHLKGKAKKLEDPWDIAPDHIWFMQE